MHIIGRGEQADSPLEQLSGGIDAPAGQLQPAEQPSATLSPACLAASKARSKAALLSLYARNPEPGAAALSEHIFARPRADGTWTYCWPWAEPIANTPATAAAIIVRVLRPTETP